MTRQKGRTYPKNIELARVDKKMREQGLIPITNAQLANQCHWLRKQKEEIEKTGRKTIIAPIDPYHLYLKTTIAFVLYADPPKDQETEQ